MNKKSSIIVITGASAGVGRATAHAFAKKGAILGLLSRNLDRLKKTQQEVEELGGKALILPVDVADSTQVEAAAEEIEKKLGPIDVWINNAMVSVFSPAKEMTPEEYQRVTDVTYLGVVYGTLAALKRMTERDRGIIIQVGSALAYRGIPLQSAYCGAKHAIQGFTESVRCELLHDKSRVKITMIQMPALNTPQFNWVKSRLPRKPKPVPPIFQPEVAAKAIVFAARHYRPEWYVGISTCIAILIDKIAPSFGDWYLAKKGFDSQQYDGLDDPKRPNNLFESVSGDFGAHGDFDSEAAPKSIQLWMSQYRLPIILVILCVLVSIFIIF